MFSIHPIYFDKRQPILDDIAPSVAVSHYDWSEMSKNNLHRQNQVKPCNVAPENIDMSYAKIKMYTKHSRTKNNATISSKETDSIMECITTPALTSNKWRLPPEKFRLAAERSPITPLNHRIRMKKGITSSQIEWRRRRYLQKWMQWFWMDWKGTFETHIQDITLKLTAEMDL